MDVDLKDAGATSVRELVNFILARYRVKEIRYFGEVRTEFFSQIATKSGANPAAIYWAGGSFDA